MARDQIWLGLFHLICVVKENKCLNEEYLTWFGHDEIIIYCRELSLYGIRPKFGGQCG